MDNVMVALVLRASRSPRLFGWCVPSSREFNRLQHLAEQSVTKNQGRHPILIRFIERFMNAIYHFMYSRWSIYHDMKIAITWGLCRLVLVILFRLNTAKTRAAPLNIQNYAC